MMMVFDGDDGNVLTMMMMMMTVVNETNLDIQICSEVSFAFICFFTPSD